MAQVKKTVKAAPKKKVVTAKKTVKKENNDSHKLKKVSNWKSFTDSLLSA